jgi:hypothetical protein
VVLAGGVMMRTSPLGGSLTPVPLPPPGIFFGLGIGSPDFGVTVPPQAPPQQVSQQQSLR